MDFEKTLYKMWQLLICPICKDLFNNPKILPCIHSFCEQCLQGLDMEALQCPVCRATTHLPPGGVAEIPSNFFLNTILDMIRDQSANRQRSVCEICSARVSNSLRCVDCDLLLCAKCLRAHDEMPREDGRMTSSPHTVHMPLTCKFHVKEDLKYYCSCCSKLVCQQCVIAKHVTHIFVSAADAVPSCRAKLSTLLGQMTSKVLFLSDALRVIKDTREQLRMNVDGVEKSMEQTTGKFQEKNFETDQSEQKLLTQLNVTSQRKYSVLNKQYLNIATRLGLLQSCRNFTTDLISTGGDNEILLLENCVTEGLGDLCQHTPEIPIECMEDSFIRFEPAVVDDQRHDISLGRIVVGEGCAGCSFATGEGLTSAGVGQAATFTVTIKNECNKICEEGPEALVARIKTPQGGYYRAKMTEVKSGKHKFTYRTYIAGAHLLRITIRGDEILGSPFELLSSGPTDYSRRGGLVTKFGRTGTGRGELKSPQGLAVDRLSRIYVADTGNDRIQVFDEQGTFLLMFGCHGNAQGKFNQPCDVTINRIGHVIVADKMNDRIQVFTSDGRYLSELTSGVVRPTAVTSDNYNNTMVVDSDHTRVLVFTASGELLRSIHTMDGKQLEHVQGVACNQAGEILLISRLTNNNEDVVTALNKTCSNLVQVLDNNWNFLHEFVTPAYPRADSGWCRLATDHDDRVLATGAGNKVQVFTMAGSHLTNISFTENAFSQIEISAITLTTNGCVVVADMLNGRILVF